MFAQVRIHLQQLNLQSLFVHVRLKSAVQTHYCRVVQLMSLAQIGRHCNFVVEIGVARIGIIFSCVQNFLSRIFNARLPLVTIEQRKRKTVLTNSLWLKLEELCYQQPMLLMRAKSDKVSCKGRCPNPSCKIFIAALRSRSCIAPHFGHVHSRIDKSFTVEFL